MSQLLTQNQAAEFFQVSPRTIRRWREQRMIPFVLLGRGSRKVIRFRLADLERVAAESILEPIIQGSGEGGPMARK